MFLFILPEWNLEWTYWCSLEHHIGHVQDIPAHYCLRYSFDQESTSWDWKWRHLCSYILWFTSDDIFGGIFFEKHNYISKYTKIWLTQTQREQSGFQFNSSNQCDDSMYIMPGEFSHQVQLFILFIVLTLRPLSQSSHPKNICRLVASLQHAAEESSCFQSAPKSDLAEKLDLSQRSLSTDHSAHVFVRHCRLK